MDNLPPFELLKKINNKFPLIWEVLGEYAKNPEWDERCYVPIGLAMEIFPDFHQVDWEHQLRRMYYAIQFSALAVWRLDKEIFQFSPELEEILFEQSKSDDDMDIPGKVLEYLPYRAFYVRFSSPQVDGGVTFDGFFVHYEWDTQRGGELCIRFLFLTEDLDVASAEIKLSARTLSENFVIFNQLVKKNIKEMEKDSQNDFDKPSKFHYINASKDMIKKALELTLYICAQNADITASPKQATYRPKKGKIVDRYAEVRTWDVGVRIGAKVRLARSQHTSQKQSHVSHASPRTHMRRGHWHHYWTGPKDGERKLILKWTAPMLIGGIDENSPTVIHKVETEGQDKK